MMLRSCIESKLKRDEWPTAAAAVHEVATAMKTKMSLFMKNLADKIEKGANYTH